MSKFSFKHEIMSQLQVCCLHTACCPHWNLQLTDIRQQFQICAFRKNSTEFYQE